MDLARRNGHQISTSSVRHAPHTERDLETGVRLEMLHCAYRAIHFLVGLRELTFETTTPLCRRQGRAPKPVQASSPSMQ
jgi:hypothetical protein